MLKAQSKYPTHATLIYSGAKLSQCSWKSIHQHKGVAIVKISVEGTKSQANKCLTINFLSDFSF